MTEASWVPVAVDPLVPAARLGALLVARRAATGLDVVDMAQRSNGMFTPAFLEGAERGRVELDDDVIGHLVGLYEVHTGQVVPARTELILDIDEHQLSVGDTAITFDSMYPRDVLSRYVALIYRLRGQTFGSKLTLREADIAVLGESLGFADIDVRREIEDLIEAPESVKNAKAVGKGRIIAAAGILVGATAFGSLVLVGNPVGNDAPTEVLGETQTFGSIGPVADTGAAAEQLIDFDFRAALPEWRIGYAEDHPDFLGVTRSEDKSILIHVEQDATPQVVAAVLMHEVGHAIDLEVLTDADRADWIELRGMPATWWPGNGLSDFAVGAGDFAEAVSAVTTNSPSSSVYGEFSQEQLDFVSAILARTS